MNRKISITLFLVVTLMFSLLVFTGCGDGDKQIPVYQGMTITKSNSTLSLTSTSYRSGEIILLSSNNGNNGNNGNHNGHYKGDHTDRNDTIDEENPYPDNDANENIEEEIASSLNVVGSPDKIYYATPNEDIYINIHIDNPDSFEIMSFTLNGKKYSSYMFEEGSDMETIVLKYNVGNAAGIVEYTIDAIKYIDGTEIKDVIIDGNKTVMAGVKTENQVAASVTDVNIDTNTLSFNVNIKDSNALVEFSKGALKAVLYDGFNIISEKDLQVGDNTVTFDGLQTNTLYQYAVVGYYDDLSGNGFAMNVLYKDAFYTDSVVLFDNITVGQESISFSFHWHEDHQDKAISALKLYKGDSFIKDVTANATAVNELLSNTAYKLVAEYPGADKTESIYIEFTTLAKQTPDLTITNTAKGQESLNFSVSVTDIDSVGAITKVEFIHGAEVTVLANITAHEIKNLLSNNDYTIKVTYTYDLNDGIGNREIVKELTAKTEAKAVPSFETKNENITTEGIDADYEIIDSDSILASYKVELYKGAALVSQNTEKNISFASLDYYTDYTLKITYTYNLNDGNGEQTGVFEKNYKTLPYIDVVECNVANTSAVSEGETIFMSVKLDNPLNMTIESVVINGKTYSVTGASTKNKIFVEIVYNGQFTGGDTYLKVDKVNAKIDSTALTVAPRTVLSDNVFINGKLEVLKIEYVNEDFEAIDWAFPSEKVYVLITLNNPTGYTVDNINTDVQGLIKIDNNKWYYETTLGTGWNSSTLDSISYHNEYITKTLTYSDIIEYCYKVISDEIKYISTADSLKYMNEGYYYELANDIDLSGIEWIGADFDGVFNGKTYSIKNMSYVGTINNSEMHLGLFAYGRGIIKNLTMEEATIIAELSSNDNTTYDAYCGGIVARGDHLLISSCCVDAYSVISIKNSSSGSHSASCAYVGGIFGRGEEYIWLHNNTNYANISAEAECPSAGGIVGCGNVYLGGEDIIITTSLNYGKIYSNGYFGDAGGISGSGGSISDCANYGSVFAKYQAGGIAGWGGNSYIMNCANFGEVIGEGDATGGIVGMPWNSKISGCINIGVVSSTGSCGAIGGEILSNHNINNCYSTTAYCKQDSICSTDQLNRKAFFTETLTWSEDIWDFSELDFENGKYPKLKR